MSTRAPTKPAARSFTLTELLVAMGIIAVLAALTTIAVKGIAEDSRLASGKNTVTAVLSQARALAMKNANPVVVTFRAVPISEEEQAIESVTAEYSGSTYYVDTAGFVDRFVPVPGVAYRRLPRGINVATPMYQYNEDDRWVACSNFAGMRRTDPETAGAVIGVMFDANGTVITRSAERDTSQVFIDFNSDGLQRQGKGITPTFDKPNLGGVPSAYPNNESYCDHGYGSQQFTCQAQIDDEPYVFMAPFLAVFDEDECRSRYDTLAWSDARTRTDDISAYVNEFSTRLYFNRSTGVVMSTENR